MEWNTCAGGVLGFEQPHYAFPVEAASTQQHGFGARVLPAHYRQPVMSVTARDFLQAAVLHRLGHHQQPGVTARHIEIHTDRFIYISGNALDEMT